MKTDRSDSSPAIPSTTTAVISSVSRPLIAMSSSMSVVNISASISSVPSFAAQPMNYQADRSCPSTSAARFDSCLPAAIAHAPAIPLPHITPAMPFQFTATALNAMPLNTADLQVSTSDLQGARGSSGHQAITLATSENIAAAREIFECAGQSASPKNKFAISPAPTRNKKAFIQYITQSTPDIAERILDDTGIFYKLTLKNLIGKSIANNEERESINVALRHFMLKENLPEYNQYITDINENMLLSQPDKVKLVTSHAESVLSRYRATGPVWFGQKKIINHQDFVRALNNDFIEILFNFGATEEQISYYVYFHKINQQIIQRNALLMTEEDIEDNIIPVDKHEAITIMDMQNCSTNFQRWLERIFAHLDPNLPISDVDTLQMLTHPESDDSDEFEPGEMNAMPDGIVDAIAQPEDLEHQATLSAIKTLQLNYLRSAPLFTLFKQVLHHNPLLMRRSIINPDERAVMMARQLHHYHRILDREDCLRALAFTTATPVLNFVLGDDAPDTGIDPLQSYYGRRGLPFRQVFDWITDHRISIDRLVNMGLYINEQMSEITLTGNVNLAWFDSFDDPALNRLFANRDDLMADGPQQHGMVLLESLSEIGRFIIGANYNYSQLPALLELIRTRFANHCPESCFSYLFFDDNLSSESSVPGIARWLFETDPFELTHEQIMDGVATRLKTFCKQVITKDSINAFLLQKKIIAEINNTVSKDKIYSFMAKYFSKPLILQDSDARFLKFYDIAGNEYPGRPAEVAGAAVIRPGYFIPVAQSGELQATLPLRYHNSWTLLTALIQHLKQDSGQFPSEKARNEEMLSAGQLLLGQQAFHNL